jgi:hypothetical protein
MTMTHANAELKKTLILIREINNLLNKNRLPLKRLAGRVAPDLSPELEEETTELKQQLQQYLHIIGGNTTQNSAHLPQATGVSSTNATTANSIALPSIQTPTDQEQRPSDTINGNRKILMPDATKPPIRSRNKGFDLLLIAAPHARERFGFPISHDVLFELAKDYDPQVTRPTMVSKVNRYKNDKDWLNWETSEDIQITQKGRAAYKTLYLLADRDGDLPRVKQTFREKWNIDLPS